MLMAAVAAPWRLRSCLGPLGSVGPGASSTLGWRRLDSRHFRKGPPNFVGRSSRGGRNSYYDDLGLTSEASSRDIKEAYYKLSKLYHPDLKGDEDPRALRKFHEISEAYDTLSDPRLRRLYDKGTMGKGTSVADREASKHEFEGDSFYQGRAAYREEFRSGSASRSGRPGALDGYVLRVRRSTFLKQEKGMAARNTLEELSEDYFGKVPERTMREREKSRSGHQGHQQTFHRPETVRGAPLGIGKALALASCLSLILFILAGVLR